MSHLRANSSSEAETHGTTSSGLSGLLRIDISPHFGITRDILSWFSLSTLSLEKMKEYPWSGNVC